MTGEQDRERMLDAVTGFKDQLADWVIYLGYPILLFEFSIIGIELFARFSK